MRIAFLCLLVSMTLASSAQMLSYESAKKYLAIRIYPKETVDQHGGTDSLVARTDLSGTYSLLMLDLPGAFTPVRKKMFDLWGKTAAEAFQAAQANVDSQHVERVTNTYEYQGAQIDVTVLGDENYAASYALDLANNSPELLGEWGCVLAMPHKGLVLLCKVGHDKPLDFVKFIQMTLPLTEKSYHNNPQPISDHYFWYYKGEFTPIAVTVDAQGAIQVVAPIALGELVSKKP